MGDKLRPSLFLFLFLFFLASLCSCGEKEVKEDQIYSRQLFQDSSNEIIKYINYISCATDSTQLDSISQRFEKRITEINFSYPPDTDLNLTEEENDSLFKLLTQLEKIKKQKQKDLIKSDNDTIK